MDSLNDNMHGDELITTKEGLGDHVFCVPISLLNNYRRQNNITQSLIELMYSYNQILFTKLFWKVPSRGCQMVRVSRLGLAMAPTVSLKVLTNFRLRLVASCEQILTNFNQK